MSKAERKVKLLAKCKELLTSHTKIVLVNADNVGSSQMAKIRAEFYKIDATLFMGKNTLIRKALREVMSENAELAALQRVINEIKLNVGLVFVKDDLAKVNDVIKAQRRPAPARAGAVSPVDVIVPAGPTGMEPTMTSFLQALNISSKIMKGQVEILADVHLIKQGSKVGGSEATLLQKLKILPFSYGLQPQTVYDDGSMFPASVLDLKDEDVLASFMIGAQRAKGLALAASVPCSATVVPFLLHNYREKVLALALGSGFIFKQAEKIKEMIDNPDAFAAAAPAAAAGGAAGGAAAAPAKEEEKEEEEEEDMGFGLFD